MSTEVIFCFVFTRQVKVGDIIELDHAGGKKGQKSDRKKGVIAKRKGWTIRSDKTSVRLVF